MTFDTVIRGGTVVDGTGAPARTADVGIRDGVIAEVGDSLDRGRQEIDADGHVVTPGFVDPHTHLDAQLCWDAAASPSTLHGVTSVVLGICGFGIAPCHDGDGEYLLRSLEAVEEIPYASASLGVGFEWTTWGEFMQHLTSRELGVNTAGMVPHSALRYYVMGERGRSERATEAERDAMAAELRRAIGDGALGFATSRGPNHTDGNGDPVPSRAADDDELRALVQRVPRPGVADQRQDEVRGRRRRPQRRGRHGTPTWSEDAGARLTWSPLFAEPGSTFWKDVLDHNRALNARHDGRAAGEPAGGHGDAPVRSPVGGDAHPGLGSDHAPLLRGAARGTTRDAGVIGVPRRAARVTGGRIGDVRARLLGVGDQRIARPRRPARYHRARRCRRGGRRPDRLPVRHRRGRRPAHRAPDPGGQPRPGRRGGDVRRRPRADRAR